MNKPYYRGTRENAKVDLETRVAALEKDNALTLKEITIAFKRLKNVENRVEELESKEVRYETN